MNLKRFFTVFALIVCLIIILNTLAFYLIGWNASKQAEKESVEHIAKRLSRTVQLQLKGLSVAVDNVARRPRIAMLMETGNLLQLAAEAENVSGGMVGALRVRFLSADVSEPDLLHKPHMGYADLEMVHAAVKSKQLPAVHEFKTANKHIAIARPVLADGEVVGVVLASISTKIFTGLLSSSTLPGMMEMTQGQLSLGAMGNSELKTDAPLGTLKIPGTNWQIRYWANSQWDSQLIYILSAAVVAILLVACLVFFLHRWFMDQFVSDQTIIISVVRALQAGKIQGNYPVKIRDFEPLIANLIQLKRGSTGQVDPVATPTLAVDDNLDQELAIPSASFLGTDMDTGVQVENTSHSSVPASIFRAYDIRGVVDETLTETVIGLIGRAVGTSAHQIGQTSVVIAHDGRESSPRLSDALSQGLLSTGCNVIDLGLVPTPLLYFATHFLDSNCGVVITGSHNPREYNGLKIVIDGETLSGKQIQQLRAQIEAGNFVEGEGSRDSRDLIPDYVGTIVDDVQVGSPLKVIVDCGNGVAGKLAPVLLRTLGCEVVELYCDIDGNFPNHHPDPSKLENLQDLIAKVQQEGANLGLAFDGDGDRLGVVDSSGKVIWPDRQMMLYSADVLSRQPGADIIFDVKCSRNLSKEIVNLGGRPLMWKTGHSLIKEKIKETNAALAGEMSGHIYFGERWFGFDDGLYAAARLVEIISADPRPSSEIFEEIPDSVNTPEINIPLQEGENVSFVEQLLADQPFPEAKITGIDGIRADFLGGWGLVRASNTTPSLVLRFEADNDEELKRIQEKFKIAMQKVKADIQVPF